MGSERTNSTRPRRTYQRACGVDAALGGALAALAHFSARAIATRRAFRDAVSGIQVARTRSVAPKNRFRAVNQRIAEESAGAAAVHFVVDDLTFGASTANGGCVTRTCKSAANNRNKFATSWKWKIDSGERFG